MKKLLVLVMLVMGSMSSYSFVGGILNSVKDRVINSAKNKVTEKVTNTVNDAVNDAVDNAVDGTIGKKVKNKKVKLKTQKELNEEMELIGTKVKISKDGKRAEFSGTILNNSDRPGYLQAAIPCKDQNGALIQEATVISPKLEASEKHSFAVFAVAQGSEQKIASCDLKDVKKYFQSLLVN